jgi:hypothetical protein
VKFYSLDTLKWEVYMKFSEWILAREEAEVMRWGDRDAMMAFTAKNLKDNPHAQKIGGPIKMAPPKSEKKPLAPPPVPHKKMKKA